MQAKQQAAANVEERQQPHVKLLLYFKATHCGKTRRELIIAIQYEKHLLSFNIKFSSNKKFIFGLF